MLSSPIISFLSLPSTLLLLHHRHSLHTTASSVGDALFTQWSGSTSSPPVAVAEPRGPGAEEGGGKDRWPGAFFLFPKERASEAEM